MIKEGGYAYITLTKDRAYKEITLDTEDKITSAFTEIFFMLTLDDDHFIKPINFTYKDNKITIEMKRYRQFREILLEDKKYDKDKVIKGLIEAVCYLHWNGIYSNDIKSDNILLDDLDNPILIDFGSYGTYKGDIGFCTLDYKHKINDQDREYNDVWQLGLVILNIVLDGELEKETLDKNDTEWYNLALRKVKKVQGKYKKILNLMITEKNETSISDIANLLYPKLTVKKLDLHKEPKKLYDSIIDRHKEITRLTISDDVLKYASYLHRWYDIDISLFISMLIHDRDDAHKFYYECEMENKDEYIVNIFKKRF